MQAVVSISSTGAASKNSLDLAGGFTFLHTELVISQDNCTIRAITHRGLYPETNGAITLDYRDGAGRGHP